MVALRASALSYATSILNRCCTVGMTGRRARADSAPGPGIPIVRRQPHDPDGVALTLAALAAWMARRPPSERHSYGLGRAEIIAALVNASAMLAIIAVLSYEAFLRLRQPAEVHGGVAALVALVGLAVNLGVMHRLAPHHHDLNARAARLHVLGDALGSVAALASGAVIALTGWMPIDPLASLFICVLIAVSSVRLIRESLHALMEGVPHGLCVDTIGAEMARIGGVVSVHDLH